MARKATRAPAKSEASPNAAEPDAPKAIVLFSDGTANSSGKLFKTNVWRMYEAVDLGPTSEGKRKQIAFYDNGVGTSAMSLLAVLSGVFGFGLKRNILEIYRYACRNYTPLAGETEGQEAPPGGDEIYAFGFSRGAFTIRVLIALIASQGLVHASDERDLLRKSKDAYRAFRSRSVPRRLGWPTRVWRAGRAVLSGAWRKLRGLETYDPSKNYHPTIRFIGVWDTVAAYGGPIVEITRGIDNWLYALSMPNYRLNPRVQRARHAMAIDDERDAFHPLLWDEVYEDRLVAAGTVPRNRLQQVWFTGMHADVGGGYPDESLSYVSFLWMLNEARRSGLRTLRVITERFRALANSAGPLHDSRSGPGSYYRYQPRNIGAWLHPPDTESIVHDPQLVDDDNQKQGLLTRVHVHESVLARIASGTDGYAPFTLPDQIRIVPDPLGETALQRDDLTPELPLGDEPQAPPLLSAEVRARLSQVDVGMARCRAMAAVWDLVWRRRLAYFATLFSTIALVLMPWWIDHVWAPPVLADGRTWIGGIIRMLSVVTPDFLDPLIETMADNSFYFLLIVLLIGFFMRRGQALEVKLRDEARRIWRETLVVDGPLPAVPDAGWIQKLRTSLLYRRPLRVIKWSVLPLLVAMLIATALGWLLIGVITQFQLPGLEKGSALCPRGPRTEPIEVVRFDFTTSATCVPVPGVLERGQAYIVEMEVIEPWHDGSPGATPLGLSARERGWKGWVGIPLRRVITANYLQPILTIRRRPGLFQTRDRIHMERLELAPQLESQAIWRTTIVAPRTGEAALFANDAVLPSLFGVGRFYGNNRGSACVTIWRADQAAKVPPLAVGSACIEADQRANERAEKEEERAADVESRRRAIAARRAVSGR